MKNINWDNINWDKRTTEIAKELGIAPSSVSYHRNGIDRFREKRVSYHIDWSDVDWSKPNFAISREKKASPSAVIAARRAFAPDHLKVGRRIAGSHSKLHFRDHYRGKRTHDNVGIENAPQAVTNRREAIANAHRNSVVVITERTRYEMSNSTNCQVGAPIVAPFIVAGRPMPNHAQPSWLKRKLIALRDWLFNLCISVEKEANK